MSQPSVIKGFDFTSAPKRSKPITCAYGVLIGDVLEIEGVARITDFEQFEAALDEPGPGIAGFDFPFSLPRAFLEEVGWPLQWEQLVSELPHKGATSFRMTI